MRLAFVGATPEEVAQGKKYESPRDFRRRLQLSEE
jgi:hypothetical protein